MYNNTKKQYGKNKIIYHIGYTLTDLPMMDNIKPMIDNIIITPPATLFTTHKPLRLSFFLNILATNVSVNHHEEAPKNTNNTPSDETTKSYPPVKKLNLANNPKNKKREKVAKNKTNITKKKAKK